MEVQIVVTTDSCKSHLIVTVLDFVASFHFRLWTLVSPCGSHSAFNVDYIR